MSYFRSNGITSWFSSCKLKNIAISDISGITSRKRLFSLIDRKYPYELNIFFKKHNYMNSYRYMKQHEWLHDVRILTQLLKLEKNKEKKKS